MTQSAKSPRKVPSQRSPASSFSRYRGWWLRRRWRPGHGPELLALPALPSTPPAISSSRIRGIREFARCSRAARSQLLPVMELRIIQATGGPRRMPNFICRTASRSPPRVASTSPIREMAASACSLPRHRYYRRSTPEVWSTTAVTLHRGSRPDPSSESLARTWPPRVPNQIPSRLPPPGAPSHP